MQNANPPSKRGSVIDRSLFHRTSLIPILALVGLGADGLSSSCYGPEEAYVALAGHPHLVIYVALLSVLTICIISASYCQIIELFPRGGGGYLVASKLLSPICGLVSGCALLVDYVMTVTISIAAGIDALLSLAPLTQVSWGIEIKLLSIILLTAVNLRGVRESVLPWIPVFLLFVGTHLFAIVWSCISQASAFPTVFAGVVEDTNAVHSSVGTWGLLFLLLRSFSMGAGTFTGIEAVSNGMSIIREPKIKNAKRTMIYIAASLSIAVLGLVVSFLLYNVKPQPGETINAVMLGSVGRDLGGRFGYLFQPIALFSETALLFIAAETGFLGGPQILSNMALDRWFPHRFVSLSDRFVMLHGILLIGLAATAIMLYTRGSVDTLVILYSLSVFITFSLSQIGMVKHWWQVRNEEPAWIKKILVSSLGAILTIGILISLLLIKFEQGAWLTLLAVAGLVCVGLAIRNYYASFVTSLSKVYRFIPPHVQKTQPPENRRHTAVMMLSGVSGITQHSIANLLHLFGDIFDHFVFLHVGLIDAGNFKGEAEIEKLQRYVNKDADKLVSLMQRKGYSAEAVVSIGLDIAEEVEKLAKEIMHNHPSSVFIGGQLVMPKETIVTRWLHNQTLYSIQRRLYSLQYPCITIPVYFKQRDAKVVALNPNIHPLPVSGRKNDFTAVSLRLPKESLFFDKDSP